MFLRRLTRRCFAHQGLVPARPTRRWVASTAGGDTVDFGYESIPRDQKQGRVGDVFRNVAESYDVMNDAMSAGTHRLWKEYLVNDVIKPWVGMRHLDVAGGTGDISFRIVSALQAAYAQNHQVSGHLDHFPQVQESKFPQSHVVMTDINASMLQVGAERASAERFLDEDELNSVPTVPLVSERVPEGTYTEGDFAQAGVDATSGRISLQLQTVNAEALPFDDSTFDSYSIAFGLRNVTDRPAALREAARVLKPGGQFVCLEFSPQLDEPFKMLTPAYEAFSFEVIPRLGQALANDAESYQYLVESIRQFLTAEELCTMMRECGMQGVTATPLSLGVVNVHQGFKF